MKLRLSLLCGLATLTTVPLFGCGGGGTPSTSTQTYASAGIGLGASRTGALTLNAKSDGTASGQLQLNDPSRAKTRALFTISLTGTSGTSGFSLTGSFTASDGTVFNVSVTGTLPASGTSGGGTITIVLNGVTYAGTFAAASATFDRTLLLHTWTIKNLSKNGATVNCPGELPDGSTSCGSGTVTFNADGTSSGSSGARSTWSLTGDQFFEPTDTPGEIVYETVILLTNSEFRLRSNDGAVTTFTR